MKMHRKLIGLHQLLDEDLDQICADLAAEFGEMSGGACWSRWRRVPRLLPRAVRAALERQARPHREAIRVIVYDNYVRGVPEWLEALSRRPDLELRRQDLIEPLPQDMGHFDWIVHAAGIASPIYYRAQPLKCIDANINGLRNLLDYAVAEREQGKPLKGFLFYSSSEIYGDPGPVGDPDAGDLSRQRLLHGAARLLRRVQALRRDALRGLRQARGRAGAHRAAVQQLRARPEDYRRARHSAISRATSSPGATSSCLSDGKPKRTFCYATDAITGYLQGARARRQRRGLQHRHRPARRSRWRSWPNSPSRGARSVRVSGQGSCSARAPRPTTSSTIQIAAAPSSTRRGPISASIRRCRSRTASIDR